MTSGEQCVMTIGAALMRLWSVDSWDMQPLEVGPNISAVSFTNMYSMIDNKHDKSFYGDYWQLYWYFS